MRPDLLFFLGILHSLALLGSLRSGFPRFPEYLALFLGVCFHIRGRDHLVAPRAGEVPLIALGHVISEILLVRSQLADPRASVEVVQTPHLLLPDLPLDVFERVQRLQIERHATLRAGARFSQIVEAASAIEVTWRQCTTRAAT